MHHCHHHNNPVIDLSFLGISEPGLILTMFVTGLAGSFTHCIGMCGPIAIGQMSIRLMHTPKEKMTQWNKIQCSLALPYYIGKALTYSILALVALELSENFKDSKGFLYVGLFLMIVTGLLFIKAGLSKTFFFMELDKDNLLNKVLNKVNNFISNNTKKLSANPKGIKGWLLGMILGLIPCGLVYASIVTVVSNSDSMWLAGSAMFAFGLGTIPGLFMVAYLGQQILSRWKKPFNILYSITMFFNAYLILSYALRFIKF